MTQEERKEYEKLNTTEKALYKLAQQQHPGWGHGQCLTWAKICGVVELPPNNRGTGNETGPSIREILTAAVKKAQDYIQYEFPRIYREVRATFEQLLSKLRNAISVTWNTIVEFFKNL